MSATLPVLRTPAGVAVEHLVTGAGEPVTLFAHGLGGSITGTRPFASGVHGTKVFPHLRGHGGSGRGGMSYEAAAADVLAVAGRYAATRALGVSLGAGALARLACAKPERFDRLVLVLPGALDGPRPPEAVAYWRRVWDAVDAGDTDCLTTILAAELPATDRDTPAGRAYLAGQAAYLADRRNRRMAASLAASVPLDDAGALREVRAETLVLGCEGDARHPARVAHRLAALLPHARLHVYPEPGLLWRHRTDLRNRIAGFLNAP